MHYRSIGSGTTRQIEALLVGATIRRANVDEIRHLLVAWPPEEEQRAIAKSLDTEIQLTTIHDEAELTIALLKERRAALIAAAVTGQIDVREEDGAYPIGRGIARSGLPNVASSVIFAIRE